MEHSTSTRRMISVIEHDNALFDKYMGIVKRAMAEIHEEIAEDVNDYPTIDEHFLDYGAIITHVLTKLTHGNPHKGYEGVTVEDIIKAGVYKHERI